MSVIWEIPFVKDTSARNRKCNDLFKMIYLVMYYFVDYLNRMKALKIHIFWPFDYLQLYSDNAINS